MIKSVIYVDGKILNHKCRGIIMCEQKCIALSLPAAIPPNTIKQIGLHMNIDKNKC